jgi:hypothetical protein
MEHDELSNKPVPKPELPRTIGVLNLLFGGILLLCGMGCMWQSFMGLASGKSPHLDPKQTQDVVNEMKKSVIDELKQKEESAGNDAEKARLHEERVKLEAKKGRIEDQVDFVRVNEALVWIPRYLWLEVTSGPLLNFLMLISGIGLLQLKGWGRVLGVWVAALKIIRLVGLCILLTVVILPKLSSSLGDFVKTDAGEAVLAKAMEDQRAQPGGGNPMPDPQELVNMINVMGYGAAIAVACFGSIYPLIALIVLTRQGARLACAPERDIESNFGTDLTF